MTAEQIRELDASGTGPEEEFRNRILQEIAAQLAEIAEELKSFRRTTVHRTWPGPQ
jgi:hypothetical protein